MTKSKRHHVAQKQAVRLALLALTDQSGPTVEVWRLRAAYRRLVERYTLPHHGSATVSLILATFTQSGTVARFTFEGIDYVRLLDRAALVDGIHCASTIMLERAA